MNRRFTRHYRERVTLRDGRSALIRMVRPTDSPFLETAIALASPETLYQRFHTTKTRLTEKELEYLTRVDGVNHVCLVAIGTTGRDHWFGMGAVRFIRLRNRKDAADFAIMVGDEFQHLGLGKLLTLRICEAAKECNIQFLGGEILSTNTAMFRLLDSLPHPVEWAVTGITASFEIDLSQN